VAQFGEHAIVDREREPRLRALPPQRRRVTFESGAQRRGVGRAGRIERGSRHKADGAGERHGVGRVAGHLAQRELAQTSRGLGLVEVGAAVDRVDRLSRRRIARVETCPGPVRPRERFEVRSEIVGAVESHRRGIPQLPR
jgi:hypothetical protein